MEERIYKNESLTYAVNLFISPEFKAKMKVSRIILLTLAFLLVDARSIKKYDDVGEFLCSKATPCGWEVYEPYSRNIEYYMSSPCSCPENSKCVQSHDDISISAYVYHCREEK